MVRAHGKERLVTALVANEKGEIFDLEGYAAVGRCGEMLIPLTVGETLFMPDGGELMRLPDRYALVWNMEEGVVETLSHNPYNPEERIFPVAAFNSPGYVNTAQAAAVEEDGAEPLPLFSYCAVGWYDEGFRTASFRVDAEERQELRLMPIPKVKDGVEEMRERFPDNRLFRHLERCALSYGCPAAKNLYIGRCEAPLPTSRQCNARCLGCISFQSGPSLSSCQDRIDFTPSPEEISQVALTHFERVPNGVVSFGQGCEGDPLLAADVIEPAIALIRAQNTTGTINMNTNGSLPKVLDRLFAAGLDSIRVSMNSVRKEIYSAYFRPNGYCFEDVVESFAVAKEYGAYKAINYLNVPGVTDCLEEVEALNTFVEACSVDLIQWRNLNFDPLRYYTLMQEAGPVGLPVGIRRMIMKLEKRFPKLKHGYFNPSREMYDTRPGGRNVPKKAVGKAASGAKKKRK
ncbi:radical SAM protein [Desulfoluna butyratoxydans]|uniref:Radical sam n=1 Tax=Desulfoluna butyratoxydans TaxID=231438 RepID=A0A4U8YQ12_9BACT|nr:radical SAM protein [Desulfoluna butyratoxydans]VFQ43802.1 radical sam [Desulfoluna butyratoxydans]